MDDVLLYFSFLYEGDWNKIYEAIKNKEPLNLNRLNEFKQNNPTKYISILSPNYPSFLKHVSHPPFVLFYEGDLTLLDKNLILAMVGTRKASKKGLEITKKIAKDFVLSNVVIISGLAKGIDSMAHQTTLEENGLTIAVLGNGFNHCYPPENYELMSKVKQKGLLISEYPPFVRSKKENFPFRNRLIAALSHGIVVIEANLKSGTQITVSYGVEMGKDIYCVPSSDLEKSACNYLIKQGATLIENAFDVLENYKIYSCDKKVN